jgi:hypothetical protein
VRAGEAPDVLAIARSVAVRRSARTSAISPYVRASVRIAAPELLAGHIAQQHCP